MSAKINPFTTFVQKWRSNSTAGRAMSMPEAVQSCSGIWQSMTREERLPYVEESNIVKLQQIAQRKKQLEQMDIAQREAVERQKKMKSATDRIVMEAVQANDLENRKFLFVAFNYFTKTANSDLYIPAEFSACQFSLKQGIGGVYSSLINPGSIPLGQASDALHHSETTHELPLPPNALGERDMYKLYEEVHNFLSSNSDCEPLVVFTKREAIAKVKASLNDLQVKSCHQGQEIFVHDMEYLLFCLKKQSLQIAGLPVDDITELGIEAYLRKDLFEFSNNIACEYHEYIDKPQFCTLTWVRSWVFEFCLALCEDLQIPKMPGKHIPRVEISYNDGNPENDNESSMEVKEHRPLFGFGRGRARGRLATLGESKH